MLESFDTEKSSFPFTARIAVIDKFLLEKRRQSIIQKMVYYPVSEIRRKHLTLDRIIDYKAYTCTYYIFSGTKFYVNSSTSPVIIGVTGVFEMELQDNTQITSLSFDGNSLDTIANSSTGGLIIDITYEGV